MNKIFFTSDTHFGSERTLKFSRRPFKNVEEMDNTIINNWNKTVSDKDTVYHLGDFGNFDVIPKLNGMINLIPGNYERAIDIHGALDDKVGSDEFKGFSFYECNNLQLQLPLNKGLELVNLCHEPSLHDKNYFNLFGHIHKLCMIKQFGLNVGIDCHNFYPCDLDTIIFYKNAIENHYDKEVFL